jgi:hypothetical protein
MPANLLVFQEARVAMRETGKPMSGDQFVAKAGRPEMIVDPERLFRMLEESGGDHERVMSSIFKGYLYTQREGPDGKDWRTDQTFMRCDIWLYRWGSPDYLYIDWWLIPAGRASAYCVIKNGMAIDAGGFSR